MWLNESDQSYKMITFDPPFVNTSGFLGFMMDKDVNTFAHRMGAFITNPISFLPRQPSSSREFQAYPGGFLIHTGLPNDGFRSVFQQCWKKWGALKCPVIVHLLVEKVDWLGEMLRILENCENILAVELSFPVSNSYQEMKYTFTNIQSELPLILSADLLLSSKLDIHNIPVNMAAIHLAELRGSLPNKEGNIVSGRLYGPANFPAFLMETMRLSKLGVKVISGGVSSELHANSLFKSGADALSLDTIFWQGKAELEKFLDMIVSYEG